MKKIGLLILLLCTALTLSAQNYRKSKDAVDSATRIVWLDANFNYQLPFGELAKTFRGNFNLGTSVNYKTTSNWTFNVRFNYMFGSRLSCDLRNILGPMVNDNGDILDGYGMKATLGVEGRYWTVGGGFGKIITVSKKYRNSGIWIQANFGTLSHKIHFTDNDHLIDQLDGDYKKGYDQRSAGFCMSQFIGYIHLGKRRVASFYGGIELTEMWTHTTREYNFVTGKTDKKNRFSGLLGVKVGWIVPLYEKKKTQTLYYR